VQSVGPKKGSARAGAARRNRCFASLPDAIRTTLAATKNTKSAFAEFTPNASTDPRSAHVSEAPVVIIGTGFAAFGAGHRLDDSGRPYVAYDRNPYVGGHTASRELSGGFTFDQGPHVSFTQDADPKDPGRRSRRTLRSCPYRAGQLLAGPHPHPPTPGEPARAAGGSHREGPYGSGGRLRYARGRPGTSRLRELAPPGLWRHVRRNIPPCSTDSSTTPRRWRT
jgi:hypothetical protein